MRRLFVGNLFLLFLVLCLAPDANSQEKRAGDKTPPTASAKPKPSSMKKEVDFDALARKVNEKASMETLDNLYRATFALVDWHFVARGRFPNVRPYVASNSEIAGGQYMIRAFTDVDRLDRFAK